MCMPGNDTCNQTGPNGQCCEHYRWNKTTRECTLCPQGYTGETCDAKCPYPTYGVACQSVCACQRMLCNVVTGCPVTDGCQTPGRYGQKCDLTCPSTCQEQRCHIVDGSCSGCIAGWAGDFCNKTCKAGWFGSNCSENCSDNCIDQLCDNRHGNCTRGCLAGWMGRNCTRECPLGLFGANCKQWCSPHCAFNDTCDKTNGSCPRGCQYPFKGSNCDFRVMLQKADSVSSDNDIQYAYIGVIVVLATLNMSSCAVFIFRRRRCLDEEQKPSSVYITYPTQQTIMTDDTNVYLELHATTNDDSNHNRSSLSST
ncbi:multiple epidermal growth factor-like domains protein 10 [Ostrea edulis]|uniref:multiple epidermal growth factor-like domains protein 10 n=1 Tax=Ostrea edulis TaxID=37623 RepID=UPI0024AFA5FC|nr:multiple epidermal growth factor-like domains protein 10 [Ostrea edulis]